MGVGIGRNEDQRYLGSRRLTRDGLVHVFRPIAPIAGVLAAGIGLSACTSMLPGGGVAVEKSDGIVFVRASGANGWPDMYYSARFSVGEDQCLYVAFDDGDPALVVMSDTTRVTQDGLETNDGRFILYGDEVDVLRPNADFFDDPLDGLTGCEVSERAGVRLESTS